RLHPLTWRPLERGVQAVCLLCGGQSSQLDLILPDVIRHTALRSSDFPPPLLDEARATVRASCQHFIICDGLQPTEVQVAGQTVHNSPGDSRHRLSGRAIARLFLQSEKCGASLRRTAEGGCPYVSPLHPFVRLDWTQVPPTTTSNARRP